MNAEKQKLIEKYESIDELKKFQQQFESAIHQPSKNFAANQTT